MEMKLWKLLMILQKSTIGRFIASIAYNCGFVYIWHFFSYERDRKHPTKEMLSSKEFFRQNKERVKRNLTLLCDAESKDVYKKIIRYRITHNWRDRPTYNKRDQYFPKEIINIRGGGIKFVDCGAYNGDTVRQFKKLTKNTYDKIVAFEPDHENCEILKKTDKNMIVIEAAVYSHDTELFFQTGDASMSKVSSSGVKVVAKAIDSTPECKDATFIKMDIEGSEYDALIGAKNTIFANRPILAICIYHSDEDMIRLLELINSWNLGYRFFIRHHAQKTAETVLYAVQ